MIRKYTGNLIGLRLVLVVGILLNGLVWARPTAVARAEEAAVNTPQSITVCNYNRVALPSTVGTATPYPSTIELGGLDKQLVDVNVKLFYVNHFNPEQIDMLLVGPQGHTITLFSDAGGTFATQPFDLILDDEANSSIPQFTNNFFGGTYQPTNYGPLDSFPAPAPVPTGNSQLAVLNGTNPNGEWQLFVVDDTSTVTDGSSSIGGWCLELITTGTTSSLLVCNHDPLPIVDGDSETSVLHFEQLPNILDVNLHLLGFSHTLPSDVDMLLRAPQGLTHLVPFSDIGSEPIQNVDLFLDDSARQSLPLTGAISSGTYLPYNDGQGDIFTGAPASLTYDATTLATFNGISPNGDWWLHVVDDTAENSGLLARGWCLELTMAPLFCNTAAIAINDFAPASLYPSSVLVEGLGEDTAEVKLHLYGLSHTYPADIDILVVGPQGQNLVVMSEAGAGIDLINRNLTVQDDAVQMMPSASGLSLGPYRPTNNGLPDNFPAPAPVVSSAADFATFLGTNPNGTWSLYIVDDASGDTGTLAGGWCLEINTHDTIICNATPLEISPNTAGSATPYATEIVVSDLGLVKDVRLHLLNLTHTSPEELALLLVSPSGQNLVLMSNAGGGTDITNLHLILDDVATFTPLPDADLIQSGLYRPAQYGPNTPSFPAPAPAPSAAIALGTFNQTNPNGTWRLYVMDTVNGDGGSLAGGWCLVLNTGHYPPLVYLPFIHR
ncbi:MAG: hypothetical protein OT477_13515 [Chloroflexi bacterium]|nr:hypothetical protein [Chloroflexota bacterium]